ncbi:hypothetical protein MZD66_21275 [Escherichia coli]|uniref:hypothetical protein n=1 Tax=Escherichia TaxID=561 RepID=UPI0006A5643D|nr:MULTISPECIES: hypothetical protein [Escherichia]EFN8660781.1 hypothetical protein [Escherichia coli O2]MED9243409.1 hypothetical protein [Escherichia marmotae]WCJ00123.1 hypothetical protein phiSTEC1575Stx2k_02 [Escherichia phage phiSTEC1575-Stx2k]EEQ3000960.1 hypothetical protein [Escherichia coli]EEW4294593.1 hypothetical protein [Escherichia coli]
MSRNSDIYKLIGAAAGVENGRSEASLNYTDSQEQVFKSAFEPSNHESDDDSSSENKAILEEEEFGSNTGALHEFMQQHRMDSLQAQLDMLKSQVRDKIADATGKEIDNELRTKMASFTVCFMSWWCLFVAVMFVSFLIAHEGKPPVEAIVALLGTSTISIVGLVGFVVSGLFKSRKDGDKEK